MKYLSMNASMMIKNPFVHALEILDLGVMVGGEMVGFNQYMQLQDAIVMCYSTSRPPDTRRHTHHPHNPHSSHQVECLSQFHLNLLYFVSVCDTFESPILSPVTCRKHRKPRTPSEKSQVVVKAHVSPHNYIFYCQLILLFFFHKTCSFKHRKKVKCSNIEEGR